MWAQELNEEVGIKRTFDTNIPLVKFVSDSDDKTDEYRRTSKDK